MIEWGSIAGHVVELLLVSVATWVLAKIKGVYSAFEHMRKDVDSAHRMIRELKKEIEEWKAKNPGNQKQCG